MRGSDERTGSLFSCVELEVRVGRDHPLRTIRALTNAALGEMDGDFAKLHPAGLGRPSIAPERLLRTMLLQAFCGIRSERQLMERMEFDLLFRWFVGPGVDDPAREHSSFTKNRDRLLEGQIEAWASIKSFGKKDGGDNDPKGAGRNGERNFHKEKRSNATHESTTDPEARLYKNGDGQPARLCYAGHALMENRHGLAVDGGVRQAAGTAEREAAPAMLDRRPSRRRITLGADKAFDVRAFVKELRQRKVTPHVAVDGHPSKTGKPRATAVDGRTRRHPGYAASQRRRKRIEEVFGWIKSSAGMATVKLRGCARVDAAFTLGLAAYNLIRLPKLLAAPG